AATAFDAGSTRGTASGSTPSADEQPGARATDLSWSDPPWPTACGEAGCPAWAAGDRPTRWTSAAASDLARPPRPGPPAASGRGSRRPSRAGPGWAPAPARAHGRRKDSTAAAAPGGDRPAADQPRHYDFGRRYGQGTVREARCQGRAVDE